MPSLRLLTIGVYGFTEEHFFQKLVDAGVDRFCDVRARRGVRGSLYAFANSKRLQQRLAELGIAYVHFPDLAPSQATRQVQYAEDKKAGLGMRDRIQLGSAFIESYQRERLDDFDAASFLEEAAEGATAMAIFCVEQHPEACHRSLLTSRIQQQLGLSVEHLVP